MKSAERAALWIVATGVIVAGLYFLRGPLTQFALALILWLAIDGLAELLDKRVPFLPRALALPIAIVLILGLSALVGYVVVRNISDMVASAADYEARLDAVISQAWALFALPPPAPSVENLIARIDPGRLATELGAGLQNIASDIVFILIYLGFLFPAASVMSDKLDLIFRTPERREEARDVIARIRLSMERYLLTQTVISVIITGLTYATLLAFGLPNALFWSFLIFFLNYIPTIGSIVAVVLTTAAALVQMPTLAHVAGVAIGVSVWQFVIGNFLQPRMTGESLNLSAVVVLLALAIWGLIWGIAGAFLAAPLTVMLMIVLAQFSSTRWIAILLSADGRPTPHDARVSKA
ncbi:MAG: AI-2E family transporter [Hyphomonadaceae bacterium]